MKKYPDIREKFFKTQVSSKPGVEDFCGDAVGAWNFVEKSLQETEKRVREEIYAKCQKEANKYFIDPLFPNVKVAVTEILLSVLTQPKEENNV